MAAAAATSRASRGRPGSFKKARDLIVLLSSLSETGDGLSVEAITERLNVSPEYAQKLIDMIWSDGGIGLAYQETDEGTLALFTDVDTQSLRLTESETDALFLALEWLGIADDDPLRDKLIPYFSPDSSPDVKRYYNCFRTDSNTSKLLTTITHAIALNHQLYFMYMGLNDSAPKLHHVQPERVRLTSGFWHLDASDFDRNGQARDFRLDRMTDLEEISSRVKTQTTSEELSYEPEKRTVHITFHDTRYLTLLYWVGLIFEEPDETGAVRAETYYFPESPYLPRMIAACGGTATTDDPLLNDSIMTYARQMLAEAAQDTGDVTS